MQVAQLEKEKREMNERLRITAKRIDHIERAYRKEERPLLAQDYEEQQQHDRQTFEEIQRQRIESSKKAHQEDIETKGRLKRMLPDFESWKQVLAERKGDAYRKRLEAAAKKIEQEKAKRKAAVLKAWEEEKAKREKEEAERKAKEEEERKLEEGVMVSPSIFVFSDAEFMFLQLAAQKRNASAGKRRRGLQRKRLLARRKRRSSPPPVRHAKRNAKKPWKKHVSNNNARKRRKNVGGNVASNKKGNKRKRNRRHLSVLSADRLPSVLPMAKNLLGEEVRLEQELQGQHRSHLGQRVLRLPPPLQVERRSIGQVRWAAAAADGGNVRPRKLLLQLGLLPLGPRRQRCRPRRRNPRRMRMGSRLLGRVVVGRGGRVGCNRRLEDVEGWFFFDIVYLLKLMRCSLPQLPSSLFPHTGPST